MYLYSLSWNRRKGLDQETDLSAYTGFVFFFQSVNWITYSFSWVYYSQFSVAMRSAHRDLSASCEASRISKTGYIHSTARWV